MKEFEGTMSKERTILQVGIDVGSTTTKIAALDVKSRRVIYSDYQRHHADQVKSVSDALWKLYGRFPDAQFHLALTGSGAKRLGDALGVPYVQEVVANSIALRSKYEDVGTAIELGGQDAKIIFFRKNADSGQLEVADMRMNGSCAGGTGAFIDEVAAILHVSIEEFDALAAKGDCVYDVSGRCGVYAKTDIQPLLNQGVSKENLALSAFHAIAKQTIGGLAQGLEIKKPVAFEGGPLTFNPTLIRVFAQRLELAPEDILVPERPELMMAYGAALSLETLYAGQDTQVRPERIMDGLQHVKEAAGEGEKGRPFFESQEERRAFEEKHALPRWEPIRLHPGQKVRAYLGIDSGSTTTKFVLMDEEENILDSFYSPNQGAPLDVAKKALLELRDRYRSAGAELEILGVGTTGYGEQLFANAFSAECHVVETVAHARAAAKYVPNATFLLDIGGQDMKAIWLSNGVITNIVVNEACSSGCGSFLENFAASLHIPVDQIAQAAFDAQNPAHLGSRCTVFMNSSIVTEQRNGKLPGDIMAGLCRSIIENVFTKVIRISNLDSLGDTIVVQGGTFRNDAVLRALEQYTAVHRPQRHPGPLPRGDGGHRRGPAHQGAHGGAGAHLHRPGRPGGLRLHPAGQLPLSLLRQPLQAHHHHLLQRQLLGDQQSGGRSWATPGTRRCGSSSRPKTRRRRRFPTCSSCGRSCSSRSTPFPRSRSGGTRSSACPGCCPSGTPCPSGPPSSAPWGSR